MQMNTKKLDIKRAGGLNRESLLSVAKTCSKKSLAIGCAMVLGLGIYSAQAQAKIGTDGFVKNVMIFSKQNGHNQSMVSTVNQLKALAQEHNFTLYEASDANMLAYSNLKAKNIQVVVWGPNEGGDGVLPEGPLQTGFQQWVEEGGGYIGVHSGNALGVRTWPWQFANVIQTYNGDTGDGVKGPLTVYDSTVTVTQYKPLPKHVKRMMAGLSKSNNFTDEWYSMYGDPRSSIALEHEPGFRKDWKEEWGDPSYGLRDVWVLSFTDDGDWTKSDGKKVGSQTVMGQFHPISWAHFTKKGRTIINLGLHNTQIFSQNNNWNANLLWRNLGWTAGDPYYFDTTATNVKFNNIAAQSGSKSISMGAERGNLVVGFTGEAAHNLTVTALNGKIVYRASGHGSKSYALKNLSRGVYEVRAKLGPKSFAHKYIQN
jgi:hypothetical protein